MEKVQLGSNHDAISIGGKEYQLHETSSAPLPDHEGIWVATFEIIGYPQADLAIVNVLPGWHTPFQLVNNGTSTIEAFISGRGTLYVQRGNSMIQHNFDDSSPFRIPPVRIAVGDLMCWIAHPEMGEDSMLTFFELCDPVFEDGRFTDLAEDNHRAAGIAQIVNQRLNPES